FMATVLGDWPLRPLAIQSATALSTVYPALGFNPGVQLLVQHLELVLNVSLRSAGICRRLRRGDTTPMNWDYVLQAPLGPVRPALLEARLAECVLTHVYVLVVDAP